MEIATKYNLNDELWFIHPQIFMPVVAKVKGCTVEFISKPEHKSDGKRGLIPTGNYLPDSIRETYKLVDKTGKEYTALGTKLFPVKEELIESLK